jgi:hypothetical protein
MNLPVTAVLSVMYVFDVIASVFVKKPIQVTFGFLTIIYISSVIEIVVISFLYHKSHIGRVHRFLRRT